MSYRFGRVAELMSDKALLNCEHPFDEVSSYAYHSMNIAIKEEIEKELHMPLTPRMEQIKAELLEEKNSFYADPRHWNNNKRKRSHLPVLRGKVNRNRSKTYHPTPMCFYLIEDAIDAALEDKYKNEEFFNKFVDIKDMTIGDKYEVQNR